MVRIGIIGSQRWIDVDAMRDALSLFHRHHANNVTLVLADRTEAATMARTLASVWGWEVVSADRRPDTQKASRSEIDGVITFLMPRDKAAIAMTTACLKRGYKIWVVRPGVQPQTLLPSV